MTVLSIPTYEPSLTAASPGADFISAANSIPVPPSPPPSSQPTVASSNGAIQPNTILGIVISLVGFIVLILAFSFISRFPYFRQPQGVPPTLPPPPRSQPSPHIDPSHVFVSEDVRLSSLNTSRHLHNHNHHINGPRPRPRSLIQHVELTVTSMLTLTENRTQHYDHNPPYLPPYGGPSPPPYPDALQHPPQHLHSPPPTAVVEA